MSKKVKYGDIDWPVETVSFTKIDNKIKLRYRAEWYDDPSALTIHELGSDDEGPNFEERDPNIKTVEELEAESAAARKRKRGEVIYACPLCKTVFKPGRKDNASVHLNGSRGRKAVCPVRKQDVNDDCTQPLNIPLVVVKK